MSLIINFNKSFDDPTYGMELALAVYMHSTYGSNAYCHDRAAHIALPVNGDKKPAAAPETPRQTLPAPA